MDKWMNKHVRDTVTGYTGTVTAYAVYANGDKRLLAESIDSTGRPIEWWLEAERVEIIDE